MSEKKKCIHDGHRKRLINTAYNAGLEKLSDVQVLEFILFYIFPRGDVNPLAHRLLDRFQNVSTVLEAGIEDLCEVEGMGETSAQKLKGLMNIFDFYYADKNKVSPAKTAGELYDRLEQLLRYKTNEIVYIMGVNAKGETVKERRLSVGSYENVKIDVKDVVLYITTQGVGRIILVHNHPGGSCHPSPADVVSTEKFKEVCNFAGCSLIDSLIVGSDGIYSITSQAIKREFKASGEGGLLLSL